MHLYDVEYVLLSYRVDTFTRIFQETQDVNFPKIVW